MCAMVLKPQDVLVALNWAVHPNVRWTFPGIAKALGISSSEAHASVKRALQSRLMYRIGDAPASVRVARENLLEFLIHGLKYVFPAERAGVTRGMPTAHAAPVLKGHFVQAGQQLPPVWPDSAGDVRGEAFKPLYKAAVKAAADDPDLYAALSLVDAIRGGSARERDLASRLLEDLIMRAG